MPQKKRNPTTPATRPRLLTPELEAYIERVHVRRSEEAARERARTDALRRTWSSDGGVELRRFVATRPSEATRRVYTQHLDAFLGWVAANCRGIDPLDLTPEDLASYERFVQESTAAASGRLLSLKTRQERVRTVRTAYAYLEDEGLVDRNPARHLRVRGRVESKQRFLEPSEAGLLVDAATGSALVDRRDRALIVFLLHTGLRAAEAAAVTWDAIARRPRPTVTVEGKGKVVRTVPFSTAALQAILEWPGDAKPATGFVFTRIEYSLAGNDGRVSGEGRWTLVDAPLSAPAIYQIVRRRAKAAKLDATPHTLRRTYATALRDAGISIDTIGRYLGHASIQTTLRYLSPRDDEAAATVQNLTLGFSSGS